MAGTWFLKEVSRGSQKAQLGVGVVNYVQHFYFGAKGRWSHVKGIMVKVTDCFLVKLPCQSWVSRLNCSKHVAHPTLSPHSEHASLQDTPPCYCRPEPGPPSGCRWALEATSTSPSADLGPAVLASMKPHDSAFLTWGPSSGLPSSFPLFPNSLVFLHPDPISSTHISPQSLPLLSGISIPWLTNSSHPYLLHWMSLYSLILAQLSPGDPISTVTSKVEAP